MNILLSDFPAFFLLVAQPCHSSTPNTSAEEKLLSPTLSPILSPPSSLRKGLLLCRKSLGLYQNMRSGEVEGKVRNTLVC